MTLTICTTTPPSGGSQVTATRHVNRLTDVVGHLASIDPLSLGAEDGIAVARAAESVVRAAEGLLVRCIRTWHDRGDPVQTPDTTEEELGWRAADAVRKALIVELGRSRGEAGRLIATARALRRDPPTGEVLREGVISAPQARIIADAMAQLAHMPTDVVDAAREGLIERARRQGTDQLREHAEVVAHQQSPTTVLNRARMAEAKRGFHLTPVLDGYIPGGFLPTVGGETLLTVLDALADTPAAGEANGRARARADALVRLAEDRLRGADLPQRRNGPAAVTVVLRADTALGLPGAPPARTGYGRTLHAAEAHMLVCESSLRAVLVDGEGDILWQGRRRRLASRAQYEALAVRDGGCTHPQCDRPAPECDAHHLIPWSEGGHTDVAEMRLLCRRHHREIHDELWQRQFAWQEAEIRRRNEQRKLTRPRVPWYVDSPAWYPGPSPWHPDAAPPDGPGPSPTPSPGPHAEPDFAAGPAPDLTAERGKEATRAPIRHPAAA